MGTVNKDIFTALKSEVATELGGTFSELRRRFSLEANDFQQVNNGYAVRFGPVSDATTLGVTRHYTADQDFEIVITKRIENTVTNDRPIEADIEDAYDQFDAILDRIIHNKLSLPNQVLNITLDSIDTPLLLNGNKILAMLMTVTVRYRSSLV